MVPRPLAGISHRRARRERGETRCTAAPQSRAGVPAGFCRTAGILAGLLRSAGILPANQPARRPVLLSTAGVPTRTQSTAGVSGGAQSRAGVSAGFCRTAGILAGRLRTSAGCPMSSDVGSRFSRAALYRRLLPYRRHPCRPPEERGHLARQSTGTEAGFTRYRRLALHTEPAWPLLTQRRRGRRERRRRKFWLGVDTAQRGKTRRASTPSLGVST
jgi:hypothetical protein